MNRQNGFVLPVVMFAMAVMMILGTVALSTAMDERQSASALVWGGAVRYSAEGALQKELTNFGQWNSLQPGDSLVRNWGYAGGNVWTRSVVWRIDADKWGDGIFEVRGDARAGQSSAALGQVGNIIAIERLINNLPAPGAIVAPGGINKNGASGTISGIDDPSCDGDTVPGLIVSDSSSLVGNDSLWVEGDPPILVNPNPVLTWEEVLSIEPTISILNETEWPTDTTIFAHDPKPVIFLTGDADLGPGQSGSGVLIVDGDLTTHGSWEWEGLLLVAESWVSNGNNTLSGAAIIGIVDASGFTVGNGNKTFNYDGCALLEARKAAGQPYAHKIAYREYF